MATVGCGAGVGARLGKTGSDGRARCSMPGRRPLLRRRAPREFGVDVVMVGDSFMGCRPWMQRPTTRWNHYALRALHSTAANETRQPPSSMLPTNRQNRADVLLQGLDLDHLDRIQAQHWPHDPAIWDLFHVERRAARAIAANDAGGDRCEATHEVLHALDNHETSS